MTDRKSRGSINLELIERKRKNSKADDNRASTRMDKQVSFLSLAKAGTEHLQLA
jgi:hypothetical protein